MNQLEVEFVKYELAKLSFQECGEYLDLYEKGLPLFAENFFAFERAITKSFVITYARPFTNNDSVDGHGVGTISTKWLKGLPDTQRELHELFTGEGRNSLIAHIDISKLKPNIWVKSGPHNNYVFEWLIPMLNQNNLSDMRGLASAAYRFCQEHQEKIKPKLPSDHIIPTA